MNTSTDLRRTVESQIQAAFLGVTLGRGISLRQAQAIDDGTRFVSSASEETNHWSRIPPDDLERDCVAHLDAEGFRYYIPALMLSVLNHYNPSSMRVIGTLGSLYPKKGDAWEQQTHRYSLLNRSQKTAIAGFVAALPELVDLDIEGQRVVQRALRDYWGEYHQR